MRFPPAPLGQVQCPACGLGLAHAGPGAGEERQEICPRCRTRLHLQVFPALFRQEKTGGPGRAAVEGEATCFFHPAKQASAVCDRCGRFMCELCDLPIGTRHVCPKCLESGLEKGDSLPEILARRVSWGRLSLLVAVVPVLLAGPFAFFMVFVVGPAAVFCGIFGWNRPGSLVHGRRRISAVLGIAIGLAEIAGLVILAISIWKGVTHG